MGRVNNKVNNKVNAALELERISNSFKGSDLDDVGGLVDSLGSCDIDHLHWTQLLNKAVTYENWDAIEKIISFLASKAENENMNFNNIFFAGGLRSMNCRSNIKKIFSLMEETFDFNDNNNIGGIAELIQYILTQKNESLDDETKDLIKYFKEKGVFRKITKEKIESYYFDKMNKEKFRYLVVDCDIYGDCLGDDNNKKAKLVVDALLSRRYDEEKNDSTVDYNMAEVLLDMPGLDLEVLKKEIGQRGKDISKRLIELLKEEMYDKVGVFSRVLEIKGEGNSEILLGKLKKKIKGSYVKEMLKCGKYYKMFRIFSISEGMKVYLKGLYKIEAGKDYKEYLMDLIYKKRYDELEEIYESGFIEKDLTKKKLEELIKEEVTQEDIRGYIRNVMRSSGGNRKLEKIYKLPFKEKYIQKEIREYIEELVDEINSGGKENFNIDKNYYRDLKRVYDISFIGGEWINQIIKGKIREDMKEELEKVSEEWTKMANERRISRDVPSQSDIVNIKSQYVDAIENGGDVVGIFNKFGTGENPSKEDGVTILLLVMSRCMQNEDKEKIDMCVEILRKEIDLLDASNDWDSIVNDIVLVGEVDILKKFCEIVKNRKELKIDWDKILQVVYYNEDMDSREGMLDILIKDCKNVFGIEWEEKLVNMNKDNSNLVAYILDTYRENLNEFKLLIEAINKGDKDLVRGIMDGYAKDGKAYDILKKVLQRVGKEKDVFGDLVIRYGNDDIRDELFSALYGGRAKASWTDFLNRDKKIKKALQEYFLEDASRLMYICKDTGALKHIEREYSNLYKGEKMAGDLLFEAAKKGDLDLIKHLIDTVIEADVGINGTNRRWLKQIKLSADEDLYDDVIRYLVQKNIKLSLNVENFLTISEHIEKNIGATGLDKVECDKESIRSIGEVMSLVSRRRKKVPLSAVRTIGSIAKGPDKI